VQPRCVWAAAILSLAACTGQKGDGTPRAVPSQRVLAGHATNWPTYHADAARSGLARGLPAAGRLAIGWSRRLDGAVYGQPLVIGNLVIAATENDTVYGLARVSGRVLWKTHVATPLPLSS
jgi:outer membrane protein assembly factor BamB